MSLLSTIDLFSDYWQCELDESAKPKTAFVSHRGLYEFKVLPFVLQRTELFPAGYGMYTPRTDLRNMPYLPG